MNRKYDLDYLQWLQKNARTYIIGLSILTFFVVVSICMYFEPWQPQSSVTFWNTTDSDQAVAEQQIPKDNRTEMQQQDNTAIKNETDITRQNMSEADTARVDESAAQQPADSTGDTAIEPQTVDLLTLQNTLPGFTVPCSGKLVYRYGPGYDAIYDDYRFHDALCYQADGAEALAAADGVVQSIDINSEWQVTLRCGAYQLCYKGLQTCVVHEGDTIIGGQTIGTAGERLYVKVIQ